MKNSKRTRIASLMGIIAIMAIVILGVTACPQETESTLASGDVIILDSVYGDFYVGTDGKILGNDGKLAADFVGIGAVTYEWYKGDAKDPFFKAKECLPTSLNVGDVITVKAFDTGDKPVQVSSASITVQTAPPEVYFLGKWIMKGSEQTPAWGGGGNEEVVITSDKFRLDAKGGTSAGDYLSYNITSWNVIQPTSFPTSKSSYQVGFTLVVTGGQTKGYGGADVDDVSSVTSIIVWGKTDANNAVIAWTRSSIVSPGSGNSPENRDFKRP